MDNANENKVPSILIHNQYIKDLSLEIPHAPEVFSEHGQPDIKIDVDIQAKNIKDNQYNVDLNFRIDGDINGQKLFIMEISYAGFVSVNVPAEHQEAVLMIEIPHMLFPYARQAISSTLANGGLPPILLNPIDFVALYKAKHQKAKTN